MAKPTNTSFLLTIVSSLTYPIYSSFLFCILSRVGMSYETNNGKTIKKEKNKCDVDIRNASGPYHGMWFKL